MLARRRGRPPKIIETSDPLILAERRKVMAETLQDFTQNVAESLNLVDPRSLSVPDLLRLLADRLEER